MTKNSNMTKDLMQCSVSNLFLKHEHKTTDLNDTIQAPTHLKICSNHNSSTKNDASQKADSLYNSNINQLHFLLPVLQYRSKITQS